MGQKPKKITHNALYYQLESTREIIWQKSESIDNSLKIELPRLQYIRLNSKKKT